jgi:hypothetical protein
MDGRAEAGSELLLELGFIDGKVSTNERDRYWPVEVLFNEISDLTEQTDVPLIHNKIGLRVKVFCGHQKANRFYKKGKVIILFSKSNLAAVSINIYAKNMYLALAGR